ncbi:efflux RND transporter permease subunit [Bacteroides helcogenes]|uniref:Acriflavin resistance protein n=1 Tax=Bacteroides helcogenes (strain ATCC 35417 / DSM 20613 / JCM 6297 / CCUG 15421 / P 36-108) TaxID=693979 RepID=E6SUJ6_BACT6|nr:efflux RND transporter permease subunit [Bacteroides helcogenes]ADV43360.1 acriflavin resistance protein [Bacteroides helcogenes P 36-108]MDY5238128.1 efflux RND transporter permease subunit [Bacteroides helcogenes]
MVKFLIQRPIAVLMAFTACFIVGMVTYFTLPVSLLPDIAIPEITVQVSAQNTSARELENTIVKPLRQQLIQVAKLKDMNSETRDGAGIIRLSFDYGTNTDLAFIEVNEKIDAAMNYLPKDANRPKVVKASATDIPVFYLNLTLKSDSAYGKTDERAFLDLCEFAENVIKRRIEQLTEVAMVDVTGLLERQLQIVPDPDKLAVLGLSIEDIETALAQNNVEPGSMTVRDGYYEYNIKFSTLLRTETDVENILLRKEGRIIRLGDFCKVGIVPVREKGVSMSNGKRAVTLAVIKQADENMDDMKDAISQTMDYFRKVYPDVDFSISRNQTELLDYTISNLQQNLSLGFLFICIVAVLFLGDVKSPFIIGLSMVVSIVICFLFFYLFKMSLNIISLSGLILALGMMIDSSIIVTENISQYRERGYSLRRACVSGTSEVITPMLSSSLTTVAVFVPLIFMSGIAGALFYDQAFAVTVGLLISYFTGIMLLPVLYMLVYRTGMRGKSWFSRIRINNPLKEHTLDRFYDAGVDWVFAHKTFSVLFCIVSVPLCVFLFYFIGKERMPEIDQNELIARVEWNENIHVDENRHRVNALFGEMKTGTVEQTAAVGQQDYLLNREQALSSSEAELYFKTATPAEISSLQQKVYQRLKAEYPLAVVSFSPPETVFEKLFVTGEADVVAELYARNKEKAPVAAELRDLEDRFSELTGITPTGVAFENQLNICIQQEELLLYNVSYDELYRVLKTAFKENSVAMLHSYQQYLPISIVGEEKTVNDVLQQTLIQTRPDKNGEVEYVPLRNLVKVGPAEDLKTISAGRNGEYIPFRFYDVGDAFPLMEDVKQAVDETGDWDTAFSGSFFSNRRMLDELVVILFISVLLMYFILAAQFESFVQPLIVLLEIPIDVAFALLLLWICGHTLNLMSAIGLIVTCGIIINDSILKLDAINELRKDGMPLLEAIHEAGRRRLRPIIMTSLTTIFAMVPLLFSFDMGSELQKPLSIAMIGAMFIGTLVSLFIIPLIYWFIYRRAADR